MFYIQLNTPTPETIDSFESESEARAMLSEYRMAAPSLPYSLETTPTEGWQD